jgi:hypothetical protein
MSIHAFLEPNVLMSQTAPIAKENITIQPRQRTAITATLEIAFEESGSASGFAVVLLHGIPYDVRQYDVVRDELVKSGRRWHRRDHKGE